MREPLSEDQGCELLAGVFRARGYAIKRDVTFSEQDVRFRIDGWDAKARVGFEFLSSEADDHHDLTLGEFKRIMAAQQRGELAIFVVDEAEQLSASDLAAAAEEFLDEMAHFLPPRRPVATKKPAPRRVAAGTKKARAKKPAPRRRK